MTITTKYNVDDMVWLMWENKPINQKITSIYSTAFKDGEQLKTSVDYNVQFCSPTYKESDLYSTKEDLLQSL